LRFFHRTRSTRTPQEAVRQTKKKAHILSSSFVFLCSLFAKNTFSPRGRAEGSRFLVNSSYHSATENDTMNDTNFSRKKEWQIPNTKTWNQSNEPWQDNTVSNIGIKPFTSLIIKNKCWWFEVFPPGILETVTTASTWKVWNKMKENKRKSWRHLSSGSSD
jgi:hypothetical protein